MVNLRTDPSLNRNGDNIHAPLRFRVDVMVVQVLIHRFEHALVFRWRDRLQRRFGASAAAGLHFDENQLITPLRDDIQLTESGRPVAFQDGVTLAAQVLSARFFLRPRRFASCLAF